MHNKHSFGKISFISLFFIVIHEVIDKTKDPKTSIWAAENVVEFWLGCSSSR